MEAQLINVKGEKVGKVDLTEAVFGLKPSKEFLHEFVTIHLANQRQHDAKVKTRTEVSGGGKKPWKQKGTGRARSGSIRSGLWRHGGIIHGPKNVKFRLEMPRQKARLALAQALAARNTDGSILFIDELKFKEPKTKLVAQMLAKLGCEGKTLIVLESANDPLKQAARNIPEVAIMMAGDLNAYMVLRAKKIIMTQPALEKLAARWN